MKKKIKKLFSLGICFMLIVSVLAGCNKKEKTDGNTEPTTVPSTEPKKEDNDKVLPGVENDLIMKVEGEIDNTKALTTLIDVDASPAFNGNPYDAAGLNWSIQPFLYDYLAFYTPFPEPTFKNSMMEKYEYDDKTVTIYLEKDMKWSDGTVLDADDVMTHFYCNVGRSTMWNYIDSIEKVDAYTIKIQYCTESPLVLNVTFNLPIMTPDEIYGQYADDYQIIAETQREFDTAINMYKYTAEGNEALVVVNEAILSFKPAPNEAVFSGQYVLDKYNSAEILFIPNEQYRQKPLISSIRGLRPGDSQAFATAILSNEYTVENGGLNVDMSVQIDKKYESTLRKVYVPELSSIGYSMNVNNYPLDIPEVRKAISYATDRNALISIAEPGSFIGDTKNSPLLPSLQQTYTTPGFMDTLTDYGYHPEKAEELLKGIGWTKNGNQWVDDKGDAPVITISTINSWPSFMMTAEAMSQMLTEFGLNIDFKPMEFGVWNDFTKSDEKMISCMFLAGADSYAHPWETFNSLFTNVRTGWPAVAPGEDVKLVAPSTGKEYNITNMLNELYTATESAEMIRLTEEFMVLANDLCGYIPVIEKAAPLRIYDPKLSFPEAELNAVQQDYYYYGNINTMLAKMMKDGLIYFVK